MPATLPPRFLRLPLSQTREGWIDPHDVVVGPARMVWVDPGAEAHPVRGQRHDVYVEQGKDGWVVDFSSTSYRWVPQEGVPPDHEPVGMIRL